MQESHVLAFLRYPSAPLVDFALTLVNLTWKEKAVIDLCGRQQYTQEAAAEQLEYSVDAVQKWYRAGIKKIMEAWSGQNWIEKIIS